MTLFSKTGAKTAPTMTRMTERSSPMLRPRLVVDGAARAIDYYTTVFGARELARFEDDGGKVVHAELELGEGRLTLKDEDDVDSAPTKLGGTAVLLMLDVEDVDAVGERMVRAGGEVVFAIGDSEHGRGGRIRDPFGHVWMISRA